jgi:hypothetical protein
VTSTHDSAGPRPRRTLALLAGAAAVVSLVLTGCGTPTPKEADLTEALVDSGLSEPVAECASSALVESLTDGELQELAERGAGGAPVDDPARTDDSADKLAKAMTACKELVASSQPSTTLAPVGEAGGTTTPATEPTTEPADGP